MAAVVERAKVPRAEPAPTRLRLGGEQVGVAAGQFAAGAGNLAFALAAARVLDPRGFARLSVFLSLYLVISLPSMSLTAATAIQPARRLSLVRKFAMASLVTAALVAVTAPLSAEALNLPVGMILVLALALPIMAPLAQGRGRLYGRYSHRRLIASFLAEPAVRLTMGLACAAAIGEVGAASGVVLGGYAAREVARAPRRVSPVRSWFGIRLPRAEILGNRPSKPAGMSGTLGSGMPQPATAAAMATPPAPAAEAVGAAGWTAAAFALLAVVQCQDLIFANAILPGSQAGSYAALSTLGGAAAFATVTIPMVLLPRAVRQDRHSLAVAVGLAAALGAAAVGAGAAAPSLIASGLFGTRYGSVAPLVVPYLAAMAMLGVARVLVAHRCATGTPRVATVLVGVVGAGQAVVIGLVGRTVGSIATTTVVAAAALSAALVAERLIRPRVVDLDLRAWVGAAIADPTVRAISAMCAVGLALRFWVLRGIWLDEATSIHQAGMSFAGMLDNLRNTDVHPPLYFSVLWVADRLFGTGELAMRSPSILAGTLVIPAAYVAARDLWDRRSGLVAAALAAVAPILVWYSQEVRMYSMFMLFALVAIWGQARVMRRGSQQDWAIFTLASAALVWTEYFGLFQVVTQQLVFAWLAWSRRRDRERLSRLLVPWALATFALLAFLAPLLPFMSHQFLVNQNAGKGFGGPSQVGLSGAQAISVYTVLTNFAWAIIGYHSAAVMAALVALWPIGILLALFLLGRNITFSTVVVVASAVLPALLLLGIGLFKRNLFDVRYISGVVVALLLLVARGITGGSRSIRVQAVACVVVAGIFAVSLGDEQVNGSNPRLYDFAGALKAVEHRAHPGDVILYDPSDIALVVSYYAPNLEALPVGAPGATPAPGHEVFVLASQNLMHPGEPGALGRELNRMRKVERQTAVIKKANVTVWVFRAPPAGGS